MATPDFVLALREHIGHEQLWLHGVTGIVLDSTGTNVLLARRSDNGHLAPLSGILEPGEEPAVGLMREVLEETGVEVEIERLAWVHVVGPYVYPNGDQALYLDLTFRCRYVSGDPWPADGENTEVGWYPLDALPEFGNDDHLERIRVAVSDDASTRFER